MLCSVSARQKKRWQGGLCRIVPPVIEKCHITILLRYHQLQGSVTLADICCFYFKFAPHLPLCWRALWHNAESLLLHYSGAAGTSFQYTHTLQNRKCVITDTMKFTGKERWKWPSLTSTYKCWCLQASNNTFLTSTEISLSHIWCILISG